MFKASSFNVRGLLDDVKKELLARDLCEYNINCLCVQETRIKESGFVNRTTIDNKHYYLWNSSNGTSAHGVGIMVDSNLTIKFQSVNERICFIT